MQILQNIYSDLFPTRNMLVLLCVFITDIYTLLIFNIYCVSVKQITSYTRILCKCAFKYFDFFIGFF